MNGALPAVAASSSTPDLVRRSGRRLPAHRAQRGCVLEPPEAVVA